MKMAFLQPIFPKPSDLTVPKRRSVLFVVKPSALATKSNSSERSMPQSSLVEPLEPMKQPSGPVLVVKRGGLLGMRSKKQVTRWWQLKYFFSKFTLNLGT